MGSTLSITVGCEQKTHERGTQRSEVKRQDPKKISRNRFKDLEHKLCSSDRKQVKKWKRALVLEHFASQTYKKASSKEIGSPRGSGVQAPHSKASRSTRIPAPERKKALGTGTRGRTQTDIQKMRKSQWRGTTSGQEAPVAAERSSGENRRPEKRREMTKAVMG